MDKAGTLGSLLLTLAVGGARGMWGWCVPATAFACFLSGFSELKVKPGACFNREARFTAPGVRSTATLIGSALFNDNAGVVRSGLLLVVSFDGPSLSEEPLGDAAAFKCLKALLNPTLTVSTL